MLRVNGLKNVRPPRISGVRWRSNGPKKNKEPAKQPAEPPRKPSLLERIAESERKRVAKYEISDKWNYNRVSFDDAVPEEHLKYPTVTATELVQEKVPPRKVKMLVRDFIEDSLYNPNYGYFPNQAAILDTRNQPFEFNKMRNLAEFQERIAEKYLEYGEEKPGTLGRQLWHTPTELFRPWYGQALARCLSAEYLLKYFPYDDFNIYEIGAGNGTLAKDILDYLRDVYPAVYERTRYNIIEISGNLAELQKRRLRDHDCVHVHNKSVFHWNTHDPAPCFFIATEVVDNFAHDAIRWDLQTLKPHQEMVVIDHEGEFDSLYTPVTDPLIKDYLRLREYLNHPPPVHRLLRASETLRRAFVNLPLAPNMSQVEYIPTRLLSLIRTLRNYFPRHRLLLTDFSELPDAIPGINAPVVQMRWENASITTSTLLVKHGYFDIFFPTNFDVLRDMYEYTLSQPPALQVFTHAEFLETYADLSKTRMRNGENAMLEFYGNVKFLF
ncbi:S-adenosyl-L-methionine-dependent methyltransferase [Schizophyllum commune]